MDKETLVIAKQIATIFFINIYKKISVVFLN
jgi:hypothetical protein